MFQILIRLFFPNFQPTVTPIYFGTSTRNVPLKAGTIKPRKWLSAFVCTTHPLTDWLVTWLLDSYWWMGVQTPSTDEYKCCLLFNSKKLPMSKRVWYSFYPQNFRKFSISANVYMQWLVDSQFSNAIFIIYQVLNVVVACKYSANN